MAKRPLKYGGGPPVEWDDAAIRAFHADKLDCYRIMAERSKRETTVQEGWRKHDRECAPCPDCGTELYEKFWGNGGWVKTEKKTEKPHDAADCVKTLKRKLAQAASR
jgi:hypothetical protein